MKKKLFKYVKCIISLIMISALTIPSYATLSSSDGSAFVTKAEFDALAADFNARLTTFEAGINSKIDSQVTSYLDRNGIWSGVAQVINSGNRDYGKIYGQGSFTRFMQGIGNSVNIITSNLGVGSGTDQAGFCAVTGTLAMFTDKINNDDIIINEITKSGMLKVTYSTIWSKTTTFNNSSQTDKMMLSACRQYQGTWDGKLWYDDIGADLNFTFIFDINGTPVASDVWARTCPLPCFFTPISEWHKTLMLFVRKGDQFTVELENLSAVKNCGYYNAPTLYYGIVIEEATVY